VDGDFAAIREQFGYRVTDPASFDPQTPRTFELADRRRDREQALFVQDQMRMSAWTISAGLRWDRYDVLVEERAFSPRLGIAWSWPRAGLVARASYDRAFQTPAIENLLLASSPAVDALSDRVVRLPVPPSRGNFYEAGVSKRLFSATRLDVTHFNTRDDQLRRRRRAAEHGGQLSNRVCAGGHRGHRDQTGRHALASALGNGRLHAHAWRRSAADRRRPLHR
jgi:outer membrane receptor protein involved in Fe transport